MALTRTIGSPANQIIDALTVNDENQTHSNILGINGTVVNGGVKVGHCSGGLLPSRAV